MKRSLITLALMSLTSACFAAQSVNESKTVTADGVVDIENVRGAVTLIAWDKTEVQVKGTLDSEAKRLVFTHSGASTQIKVEVPDNLKSGEGSVLTIYVPKASRVKTQFVSTDLKASGLRGGLQSHSVSGNLLLKDVSGRVELNAVSGDITAELASENVQASTVSGDLTITSREAVRELSLNTVSGDIDVNAELGEGAQVKGASVSGDVSLRMNKNSDAVFSLRTAAGGGIRNGLSAHKADKGMIGDEELEFTLGSGKGSVDINTVSGELALLPR